MTQTLFFYGTLMIPTRLNAVLGRPVDNVPVLRKATIKGWKMMMWGPYPALVESDDKEETITGMAYELESTHDLVLLHYYEGSNYGVEDCNIVLDESGKIIKGSVFAWVGDEGELKEGKFSIEEYMGQERRRYGVAF